MDSEPLTSGSYHAHCATDNEELTYLKRIHILRWVRFGLAFIILGAAVAIIGCEAGPLRHYHRTSEYEKVWLYLWPLNFDIRPTIAPLSCGCVIACLNLVYVVVALLPLVSWYQPIYGVLHSMLMLYMYQPHSNIKLLNILSATTALSGFITALTTLLFTIYLPSSTYPPGFTYNETLHSWTCKWKSVRDATADQQNTDTSIQAPAHFARYCSQTTAAFVLLGVLVGLEVLMGVAAAGGIWLERTVWRQRECHRFDFVNIRAKNGGV